MTESLTREVDHQKAGIALAEACGCFCLRTNSPKVTYATPGTPDVFVFLPRGKGILLWECKGPKGKSSDAQILVASKAAASGIPHVTGGYEELKAALELAGLIADV